MSKILTYIDLFAGAGGLSEGFLNAGYKPIAHIEMNPAACNTLITRLAYHYLKSDNKATVYYSYLKGEISRDELWRNIPKEVTDTVINHEISRETLKYLLDRIDGIAKEPVDIIIGGPPCQAYSVIGRSRDPNRMKNDDRNLLYLFYVDFLRHFKPKFFVFENVPGIQTAGNAEYFEDLKELFFDAGYLIDWKTLNAEDYGVLQKRRRVIIIGRKGTKRFQFPEMEVVKNSFQVKRDLFDDLPEIKPGESINDGRYKCGVNEYLEQSGIRNGEDFVMQHIARQHNERDLEIYYIAIDKWLNHKRRLKYTDLPERLQTHKKVNVFLDRFKVVDPEGHSHTMVAHIAKDGHYYIYPDLNQIRSISVREAARIQSFPDNYYFEGSRSAAFTQIGNAVPPLMAKAIAIKLKELI